MTDLRTAAMLRRVARALEEGNRLTRARLSMDHSEWGKREGLRKGPKLVEIGQASVADWNEKWRADHPEETT